MQTMRYILFTQVICQKYVIETSKLLSERTIYLNYLEDHSFTNGRILFNKIFHCLSKKSLMKYE